MNGRATIVWVSVFLLALALQSTVVARIAIAGVLPDIVLLALFVFSIRYGTFLCIITGFLLGLCQDVYSPSVLGQNALCKTITSAFCGLFNERLMNTDPLVKLVILLLAFIVHDSLYWSADAVMNDAGVLKVLGQLGARTLPRAAYTIMIDRKK